MKAHKRNLTMLAIALSSALTFIACGGGDGGSGNSTGGTVGNTAAPNVKTQAAAQQAVKIVVRAKGTSAFGVVPVMNVYVNRIPIQSVMVKNTEYQDYTLIDIANVYKDDVISVAFTNDTVDPATNNDRNLYIESISINGKIITSKDPSTTFSFGEGSQIFDNIGSMSGREDLLWNGALHFKINEDALATDAWKKVANEGESFNVLPNQKVRYGSGNQWIEKKLAYESNCTNQFFGSDPAPNTVKQCEILTTGDVPPPPPPAATWNKIANEGEHFTVSGAKTVRYGTQDKWISKTVTNEGDCTNAFFGQDPAPGIVKQCEVLGGDVVTPPPPPTGGGNGSLGQLPANPRVSAGFSEDRVQPTSERANPSNDGTGNFRTRCDPSHFAFDDPLLYPRQPGKAHLQVFFGNTGANANSTVESVANSGNSTCRGGTINRSSYFAPALVDTANNNQVVVPDASDLYYKSAYLGVRPETITPMPKGLVLMGGNVNDTTEDARWSKKHYWVCHNAGTGRGPSIPNCDVGDQLEYSIAMPQCWDGVRLDSPNHRDHMAYATGNGCPNTHPVPLVEVSFHILYPVKKQGETTNFRLATDTYNGPAGYSAYGGWINGWKEEFSNAWHKGCIINAADCHSHLLGDGRLQY